MNKPRNPLLPWWIGLAIIIPALAYVAYRIACVECGRVTPVLELMVIGVIPVVYLTLMYLTFKSQADSERRDRE